MKKSTELRWVPGSAEQKHAYYGWHDNLLCYTIDRINYREIGTKNSPTDCYYRAEGTIEFEQICENNDVHLGDYNFIRNADYNSGTPEEKTQLEKLMGACAEDYAMKLKMIKDKAAAEKAVPQR